MAHGNNRRRWFHCACRRYAVTAMTSAAMSNGSTTPLDWRAGTTSANRATLKIPTPGIPVLEMPMRNAPTMPTAHCHDSNDSIKRSHRQVPFFFHRRDAKVAEKNAENPLRREGWEVWEENCPHFP